MLIIIFINLLFIDKMELNENPLRKLGQAKATKRNLGVRHRKTVLSYNGSNINIHIDSTSAKESE